MLSKVLNCSEMKRSVITGSGSYIPTEIIKNSDFLGQEFYNEDHSVITNRTEVIIQQFQKITGIEERRYASSGINTSDMAAEAGSRAIKDSGIDQESLDFIILAHNFGDVHYNSTQTDTVPALASRVKHLLQIKNPNCIAFDVMFGCPGWILAMVQADAFFKSGLGKRALIIGAEALSRVIDPYDRNSLIFSDGAGAVVLEYAETEGGMLSSGTLSHAQEELDYLYMSHSFKKNFAEDVMYLKMKGRKVYEYALTYVPQAMKECLEKSGQSIHDLKKIFIHQANEKMDEAIVEAFYKLYGLEVPADVMPMCIQYLGNSSVATIPTLFDLVKRGCDPGHRLKAGDLVLFASVGAGMNINAVCYRHQ